MVVTAAQRWTQIDTKRDNEIYDHFTGKLRQEHCTVARSKTLDRNFDSSSCAPNPSMHPSPDPISPTGPVCDSLNPSPSFALSPLPPAEYIDHLSIHPPLSTPRSTSNNHPSSQIPHLCCLHQVHTSHRLHPATLVGSTPPCTSAPAYRHPKPPWVHIRDHPY